MSASTSRLKIGYAYDGYPTRRNVIGVARDCDYVAIADRYKYAQKAAYLLNQLARRPLIDPHDWRHQFRDELWLPRVDVLHLFNQVSYGRTPWVATFETALPRFRALLNEHHDGQAPFAAASEAALTRRAMHSLAGTACKTLIALSTCTQRIQAALLTHFPQQQAAIAAKLTVLHPPQPQLIESIADKPALADRDVRFLFVGASFFRKGGIEVLDTLAQLRRERGLPVQLTIVSSLAIDDYATKETPADQARARELLAAHRDWVSYHARLDNRAVLQLMRDADVGLLPTYADTYGYVVLEFQAAGCPVITTDVRAMPEINDDTRGWLIDVPKNSLGEARYATAAGRQRISGAIRDGLARCVTEIVANRTLIRVKAAAALRGIQQRHDPQQVSERLATIYREAALR